MATWRSIHRAVQAKKNTRTMEASVGFWEKEWAAGLIEQEKGGLSPQQKHFISNFYLILDEKGKGFSKDSKQT
jgi:hypothetical protein